MSHYDMSCHVFLLIAMQAFAAVVAMLKGTSGGKLEQVDPELVVQMMERVRCGEVIQPNSFGSEDYLVRFHTLLVVKSFKIVYFTAEIPYF